MFNVFLKKRGMSETNVSIRKPNELMSKVMICLSERG